MKDNERSSILFSVSEAANIELEFIKDMAVDAFQKSVNIYL